ncbi:MAG: M20/M25/M40 family metallo-hydrolase [Gammaproteobacteria bacterium]|nr:M20/M25/M40 family metallo-hydrolase [Gammaproteobacteria bacterium]MDH5303911.1 M20/M25/M40 family metallo-hydrolase [Gammaproteobacteria bacterium]MDH5321793.1 M20/M25/M40 family metallo-hydrolase [Gammaproteobacteria bacterium]
MKFLAKTLFLIAFTGALPAAAEEVDLDMVARIKDQAFNHSQVMHYMHYLADENGARLAASPDYQRAARWAVEELQKSGIANAQLEQAGVFGRSWAWSRVAVQMLEPEVTTLNGVPLAWSAGTDGVVTAAVVYAPLWEDPNDPGIYDLVRLAQQIEAYKARHSGKLAGKIVLLTGKRPFVLPSEPEIQRWSDADLKDMESPRAPPDYDPRAWPLLREPADQAERWISYEFIPVEIEHDFSERETRLLDRLIRFLKEEQVAAVLMTNTEGNGGVIFAENFGSHKTSAPVPPPAVQLMPEHYNRLVRLTEHGVPVVVSVDVDAEFPEHEAELMNVIAELPGNRKSNEIVMMGAHLDSWHTGTGATDNATGCAVVLEAMRILRALDVKLDRTVRLGLWDAEEHGHYGSRAYVSRYLGDPVSMQLRPAHDSFSAYFNIDTGSGKTRGILTQRIPGALAIFESLVKPFAEHGVTTVVPRKDFQTDHESFDAVGLPSFDLLQDQLDYWSHTHHSNVDTVDHVVPEDLQVSAAFLATLVYHAAMRDEMMPRDALPLPLPPQRPLPAILRD